MGVPVLPELIDYEIRDIIEILNNFSFIQTKGCCSGWSGTSDESKILSEGVPSDGTNRVWVGTPYIIIESLEDIEFMSKFIPYIMKEMIFDPEETDASSKITSFENKLNSFNLEYDAQQLCDLTLEYRNSKILCTIYIRDYNRSPEVIQNIWTLFKSILSSYGKSTIGKETGGNSSR